MKIEVSNGEIVDKYTILGIKIKHCPQMTEKYCNLLNEYSILKEAVESLKIDKDLIKQLVEVNSILWDIEDKIRIKEQEQKFDEEFIQLARSVYITNDKRFQIKKQINQISNSELKEEKIHPNYKTVETL